MSCSSPSALRAAQDDRNTPGHRPDEQVATIRANRIIAEARREALEEQHEICDDDAWEELNRLMNDDELEDAFDHILLDMDTSASPANLPSESEPEPAHAVQQNCAVAPAASWAR